MDLIKWDSLLDIDSLFENLPPLNVTGWDLATDIYEKDGQVIVEMQLPGIDPDTYEISLDGGMLRVKGERKKETETEDKSYYRKEIQRGHFERSVMLPKGEYNASEILTTKEDGVLKITVPKSS